jgi:ferredoxin-thioredoxin reductase catalytic subunit
MTIRLSDDKELVEEIRKKLKQDPHCPCRIIKSNENICMCKEFREQESGECHCGLYIKIEE